MDMLARRTLLLFLVLLAGACSLRGAMNAMTSPEDRAFAQAMVDNLRSGNEAWLQQRFDAELWTESGKQLAGVPALYPNVPGTTELVAYSVNSNNIGSASSERTQEFTMVTEGGGRWAVTKFRTLAAGGAPPRVVQWSVVPHTTEPSELAILKAMDKAVPWIWGGLIFVLLLIAGIVVLIVRGNRRRRAALAGQPPPAS
ncbi:MAG TPA: hypothetical protein VEW71_03645 [Allosphingosinicella sp.]|nr:hypothetical protein [Allosphingosinicella sp.]